MEAVDSSKFIPGQEFYAYNATYVGIAFVAYGSGPIAFSHFSLRAVDIDELFRLRMHQPLNLRSFR